jgi:hypothetical protein
MRLLAADRRRRDEQPATHLDEETREIVALAGREDVRAALDAAHTHQGRLHPLIIRMSMHGP